jgi:hypothetical protein
MVGIAEELPRQLVPSVGKTRTGFRYPGGIINKCRDYIWCIHFETLKFIIYKAVVYGRIRREKQRLPVYHDQ